MAVQRLSGAVCSALAAGAEPCPGLAPAGAEPRRFVRRSEASRGAAGRGAGPGEIGACAGGRKAGCGAGKRSARRGSSLTRASPPRLRDRAAYFNAFSRRSSLARASPSRLLATSVRIIPVMT